MNLIDWISILLTLLLQLFLFSKGPDTNRIFIRFSALFVYSGLIVFLFIIVSEHLNDLINSLELTVITQDIVSRNNVIPFITITGTMFAYFSILILNFGDFSRYVKNKNQLIKGNFTLIINFILISFFSIFIVIGSDIILAKNNIPVENILTNPNDIIGKLNNTYLTVIVLIFVVVATASTNLIANYVPSQNSLINFLPSKLSLKSSGLIVIILSFIIGSFWLTLLSQIGVLSIIDTVGSFFGPIFGIIVADIFLIKKNNLDGKDFFNSKPNSAYFYSNGWQLKSIYALFIGFIFAASTIWNVNLNFLQSFSWIIGGLISLIIYYLLSD